jgi:uncharacterized membrane protein YhhN
VWILIALTMAAVVGLLGAERFESRLGIWIAKPLASTGFVAVALVADATSSVYGRWVLAALALSWLGDVLLIPRERPRCFQAGVLSFLLGHVAFAGAFLSLDPRPLACLAAGLVLAPVAWAVLRWLQPYLPNDLRPAVYAYVAVISGMLALAVGAALSSGDQRILLGAGMFYFSDLAVARDRFVAPSFWTSAWGLPLYYGAQLVLATTAA